MNPLKDRYHVTHTSVPPEKMLGLQRGPRHWVWRYRRATEVHSGDAWNKPQLGNLPLWLRFSLFLQPFQADVRIVPSNRSWLRLAKSFNLVSNSYLFKGMIFLHLKIRGTTRHYRHTTHGCINEGVLWNCVQWRKCSSVKLKFSKHLIMTISVVTCSAPGIWEMILKLKIREFLNFNSSFNVRRWRRRRRIEDINIV